eukprot:12932132-Prorocentrum_lima.AAC.1
MPGWPACRVPDFPPSGVARGGAGLRGPGLHPLHTRSPKWPARQVTRRPTAASRDVAEAAKPI